MRILAATAFEVAECVGAAEHLRDTSSSASDTLTFTSYAKALLAESHILHNAATVTAISGGTPMEHTINLTITSTR